jgi:biopolymer transport protein ExbD
MLKKKERERIITDINITPLTDVMLVLLIIFMVTTPFIMQGNIKINLPSANAPSDENLEKFIIIGITAEGKIFLNGKEIQDENLLLEQLKTLIASSKDKKVIIEGDKATYHGTVVKIMGIAKMAGAEKLAISTIPEENKEEKTK